MSDDSFVNYLTSCDVHDGTVRRVAREDDRLRVTVECADGRFLILEFGGLRSVKMNRAVGMVLYSLSEMKESQPYRRFVFTNWDEQADACLEVVALEMTCDEIPKGTV